MSALVIFPNINPLLPKMTEQMFAATIPAHEEQISFCQKAQSDDIFYLIFAMPEDTDFVPTCGLFNCDGAQIISYSCDEITQTVTDDYTYYKVQIRFDNTDPPNEIAVPEGLYTVRVTLTSLAEDPPPTYVFETEPIYLKQTWPATMLIKYRNAVNDFDVLFEQDTAFWFYTRVEGGFPSAGFKPESKDQIMIDQNHVPTLLDSIPYIVRQIQFGAGVGIPNWQAEAIARSLSCTDWYCNGVRYCKNEGAKLEPTHSSGYPMTGWTIDLVRVADDFDTAFNLSTVYILGAGVIAFRAGYGYQFFPASPE